MSPTTTRRRDAHGIDDDARTPRPRSHSHSSASSSSRPRSKRTTTRRSGPKEPRSTKMTLFYVLCAYLFYGILTRTDEFDAAIKHAAGSAVAGGRTLGHAGEVGYHAAHELLERSAGYPGIQTASNGMYTLPFPARTSLGPRRGGSAEHNLALVVLGRIATYGIAYPAIALFNTVSFLMHYISVSLVVLLYGAHYLLLPVTQTLHLMGSTFVLVPGRLVLAIGRLFYPAYALLGGLLGIGTSLGIGAGWAGRRIERVIHDKAAAREERRAQIEDERERDRLLEDQRRQVGEIEWARARGVYAHPASQAHGTPYRSAPRFRPSRSERHRHRAMGAPSPPTPALPAAHIDLSLPARRTRIKFAEPAARTTYYSSGESSASDGSYPDEAAHLVAYPLLHPPAAATTPPIAPGQAFHFHFHQPGRDVADEAPGVVGPGGSLLSHGAGRAAATAATAAASSMMDGGPAGAGRAPEDERLARRFRSSFGLIQVTI